jgi:hypothetical protein
VPVWLLHLYATFCELRAAAHLRRSKDALRKHALFRGKLAETFQRLGLSE